MLCVTPPPPSLSLTLWPPPERFPKPSASSTHTKCPLPPSLLQASHGPHVEAKHLSAALSAKEELVKQVRVCVGGGKSRGHREFPLPPLVWL